MTTNILPSNLYFYDDKHQHRCVRIYNISRFVKLDKLNGYHFSAITFPLRELHINSSGRFHHSTLPCYHYEDVEMSLILFCNESIISKMILNDVEYVSENGKLVRKLSINSDENFFQY